MPTQQVIRVVAAIIERDDKVFAARRNADRNAGGLWEFPGGKVEAGESPTEALKRELLEELTAECSVGPFVHRSRVDVNGGVLEMSCYAATFTGASPEHSTDHDAIAWIRIDQLSSFTWAPADVPIIERLQETRQEPRSTPAEIASRTCIPSEAPTSDITNARHR